LAFLGGGLMAFGARNGRRLHQRTRHRGARMQLSVGSWIALLGFFVVELPPRCFFSTPEQSGEIMAQEMKPRPTRTKIPQPDGPPENRAAQLGLGSFSAWIFRLFVAKKAASRSTRS